MGSGVTLLVVGLMMATVGVLVAGVIIMARGGETNRKYGNKMMVWRVGLQGLTLAVVVLLLVLRSK
jgi:hypothetical protein